jgi:GH24 family phage-related lysozyme (muramidase)
MYDYARGEFEVVPTADGGTRVINRVTPKAIIDSTGRKVEGKAFDHKTIEGFNQYKERDYVDASPLRGLRADKRTAVDGSTVMTHLNMAGDETDFRLPLTRPDRPTVVDLEWVEEGGFMEGAFEVISKNVEDGTATIRVIAPGDDVDLDPDNPAQGPRINLDERTYLQYDAQTTTWEARYIDRGVSDEENAWRSLSDFLGLTLKKEDARASFQELDETQRKAVLRQFSRVEPMTWTDEELKRRAMGKPGNPKIRAELRRRRQGGKRIDASDIGPAPAGAGLNVNAVPNEGPTSPEERAREQADTDDILFDGVTSGHFTADAVKRAKSMTDDPKEQITDANLQSMVNGHFFDRLDEPEGQHFMTKFSKFIEGVEGFEGYVYDDHSGVNAVAWNQSDKKGDPTVGYGFNLNRPDAEILLNRIGKNKRRLLEGKETIDRQEAQQLLEAVNRNNLVFLRKHFKGIMMEKHKWLALLSLTYNSRWQDRGPTLIGPKITKAIKNQDWEAAAQEIEFNSSGGVPASLKKGINARRRKEAQLFRGVDL